MLIDAHTHISFNPETTATVPGLLEALDRAKIDKALVFAADIFRCPTPKLLEAIKSHTDRLCAIGSLVPRHRNIENTEELAYLEAQFKAKTICGLKIYTGYEHFYPDSEHFRRFLDLCEKYDKPVIFHSGDTFCKHKAAKLKYAHPLHIDDVATDRPNLKIVMAHLGWPWHRDAAEVLRKNPNVYTDCSGFVYGKFTPIDRIRFSKVLEEFFDIAETNDRILFGSDWPISDPANYLETFQQILLGDLPAKNSLVTQKLFGLKDYC